jgi:hypothetical protein
VIEYLRTPRRPSSAGGADLGRSGFPAIAMEMAIAKGRNTEMLTNYVNNLACRQPNQSYYSTVTAGIAFLKRKNYKAAVDVFKSFEKKDGLIDQAATNLSFLYFLEVCYRST